MLSLGYRVIPRVVLLVVGVLNTIVTIGRCMAVDLNLGIDRLLSF